MAIADTSFLCLAESNFYPFRMSPFQSGLSRILSPVLLLAMLVAVPAPAHAVTPGDSTCDLSGLGSQVDPYLVTDRTDLEEIIDCADDTTLSYYKQEAVIDLSASVWTPLVDQDPADSTGLKISYDGDHWAIVGMKAEGYWMASLFGHLAGGSEVKNLAFLGNSVGYVKTTPSSGDFNPDKHLAGVVAALSTGGLTISNVQIEGFTRISGASVGALVGQIDGGTSTVSNTFVRLIGNDPSWANDRGFISAMNSKWYGTGVGAPTVGYRDVSRAGGLIGHVTGSGVDLSISQSFVNSSVGVGGEDAEATYFGRGAASVGGLVGSFTYGSMNISSSQYSGNILGTTRSPHPNIGAAPIVGFAFSDATNYSGIVTLNISKVRVASQITGNGYLSGLVGVYRTEAGTDINISEVLATGVIASTGTNAVAAGAFHQPDISSTADLELSESVVLYKFSGFDTSRKPARAVEANRNSTVSSTYVDSSILDMDPGTTFQTDKATDLGANWTTATAPAPFSSGDADGVALSSVALMSSWTSETFAVCSGSDVLFGSGLKFYYDSNLNELVRTPNYGITLPSVEKGTCVGNELSFSYPNSGTNPTISTTRAVRNNVSSGVFAPASAGLGVTYRVDSNGNALPAGLYLNPGTGAIIGTPTADLTADLTVSVLGFTAQNTSQTVSVTFAAGSGGGSQQSVSTPAAPYSGPTISTPPTETSGGKAVLRGKNLDQVTGAEVDGVSCDISYEDEELTVEIPDSVSNGVKDLVLTGSFGRLTLQGGLILDRVVRAESSSHFWTQKQVDGSVKVYAKNVTGVGKVQFFVDGEEIAWINDVDGTDPKLRFAGGSAYLVRTVSLDPGKNRFEIKLDGVRVWRATYSG